MKKEKLISRRRWPGIFCLLFLLSLPATAKICRAGSMYDVKVDTSYLALRSSMAYDSANEIGKLYTGDSVWVENMDDSTYWYVYSPKHDLYGYVNKDYLEAHALYNSWRVNVSTGYLALRSGKAYSESNEIGELYSGDTVQVENMDDSDYWYVYSPKYETSGYVNKEYLVAQTVSETWSVSVSKGYLALRSGKAYSGKNEIGELYNGDTVQVENKDDSDYWYVYSPKYDKYGYVDKDYLTPQTTYETWKVSVAKGYLALRSEKAYSSANEIGELYSGDLVQVKNKDDSTYWYVYAPKCDAYGYVNSDYLVPENSSETWRVSVSRGYLALRTEKAYSSRNEIGELYNGDTVQVESKDDSDYWYVYSPKYDAYGYVNKDYLVR